MKVLIVSDTHGYAEPLEDIVAEEAPVDMLIHLGDVYDEADYVRRLAHCPTYIVRGNNDYDSSLMVTDEIMIGSKRALITHGHRFGVYMGTHVLSDEARTRGCDIAMYGHTHMPDIRVENGVQLVNPGSISRSRTKDRRGTYVVMEIDELGLMQFEVKYVE